MELGSTLEVDDFRSIFFTDFTAASARPLLFGLYGAASSWDILFLLQKEENGPRNCGPPSLRMDEGQPNMLNQLDKMAMIESVFRERNEE